jgi:hypothetical protein
MKARTTEVERSEQFGPTRNQFSKFSYRNRKPGTTKKWLVLELRCRRNQYLGYTNKRQNPQNSMFDHAKGHPLGTPTCPEWSPAGYHTSCCQGARPVENVCAGQQGGDTTNPTQIEWDVNSLLRTSCDMNNVILICLPNVCCANWCAT